MSLTDQQTETSARNVPSGQVSSGTDMLFVGIHIEHDAAVAVVEGNRLISYTEVQKDNNRRYSNMTSERLEQALSGIDRQPDVIGMGGWYERDGGYHGCSESVAEITDFDDQMSTRRFTTSHERAHIFCAYGLSPFEQGRPCYALIWEGEIGSFYSIDSDCNVERLATPLPEPGHRYAFLYELAHRSFPDNSNGGRYGVAGKLMALASLACDSSLTPPEQELMRFLLGEFDSGRIRKDQLRHLPFYNIGHLATVFRQFAYRYSAALFDRFYSVAKSIVKERRPLLIAGGCGLNCEWNQKWRESRLFTDVFVPPCADDSGCAIGVAVDGLRRFTGNAKLQWDVYAGEPFVWDVEVPAVSFECRALDYDHVAGLLDAGAVIAWVQGRYEIGPRALGNRSLLAAPFHTSTTDRLNRIKERESYRPVAPVCLEEEASTWFDVSEPSPYMLYFHRVRSSALRAVTHDDGSARVQTVSHAQNERLYALLRAFARKTGFGVLCNTSLNFSGRGFINRISDLIRFVTTTGVDAMVVDDVLWVRRPPAAG